MPQEAEPDGFRRQHGHARTLNLHDIAVALDQDVLAPGSVDQMHDLALFHRLLVDRAGLARACRAHLDLHLPRKQRRRPEGIGGKSIMARIRKEGEPPAFCRHLVCAGADQDDAMAGGPDRHFVRPMQRGLRQEFLIASEELPSPSAS